jgi:4-amino-4-deoxy-L-arabinose transferase-like glycosyltransferase
MNKRHWIIMLLCCLVPLAALTAIFIFQVNLNTVLLTALVLFCPISHVLMTAFSGDVRNSIAGHGVSDLESTNPGRGIGWE